MSDFPFKFCSPCDTWLDKHHFARCQTNKDGLQATCKDCQKDYKQKNRVAINQRERGRMRATRKQRAGYMREYMATTKGRARRMLDGAMRRARERHLDFNLTLEFIVEKLTIGICERTGIAFELQIGSTLYSPSLDRIDSARGYTIENVQVVCVAYNLGKKNMSDEQFEQFILAAARFIEGKNS